MSKKIEQIASKQKEIAINQTTYTPHLKAHLYNIPIPSLTTFFGRNTSKQISILETDQLTDTNHTRMKHLLMWK